MGFRFSRRVKLLPGIRVNMGLRGASLSVGGRGATLNLSKRGVRTTLGVPGTGLSWTSSSASRSHQTPAVRSGTARSTAAAERALREAEARASVEAAESEREAQVNAWRAMPVVPPEAGYLRATHAEPWPHATPTRPEEAPARAAFQVECEQRAKIKETVSVPRVVIGVLALAGSLSLGISMGSLCTGITGFVIALALLVPELSKLGRRRPLAQTYFTQEWPLHWMELQANWAAYEAWPEQERERAAFAARLLQGDLAALTESLEDSLADLDFPFEASCRIAVPEPHETFVLLDLPEIEDAISEEKLRALKSGEVKEVRRTQKERQAEYARLATGLALWVARTAFAAGPTLQRVHVAAYTQRRRTGTGELVDDYVYEACFEREVASQWRPDEVDPIEVLRSVPSRIDLRADGQLKAIRAPEWEHVASA